MGLSCTSAQWDLKRLVAFSVAHMGYVILGLAATLGSVGRGTDAAIAIAPPLASTARRCSSSPTVSCYGYNVLPRRHSLQRAHARSRSFGGLATILPTYCWPTLVTAFASARPSGLVGFWSGGCSYSGASSPDAHRCLHWRHRHGVYRWLHPVGGNRRTSSQDARPYPLGQAYRSGMIRKVPSGPLVSLWWCSVCNIARSMNSFNAAAMTLHYLRHTVGRATALTPSASVMYLLHPSACLPAAFSSC